MDEQTSLNGYKKTSQHEAGKQLALPEQEQAGLSKSFVPDQDERYLKPVTRAGYILQKNYRSYTTVQLKQALDQGDYKVVGRTFQGKRTRKTKKKEDDHHSDRMRPLVKAIDRLEEAQNEVITPENAEEMIEKLMTIYDRIFKQAFYYCQKQNPWFPEGKARKDMVLLIRDQANEERLKLAHNARILVQEVKNHPEKAYTFADAIKEIRTRKIKAGEDGIKEIQTGGKGTSDIIVAVKEDGSKLYIRPSESLKPDDVPCRAYMEETIANTREEIARIQESLEKKELTEEEKERENQNLKNLESDLKVQEMFERALSGLSQKSEEEADKVMRELSRCKPSGFIILATTGGPVKRFFQQNQELRDYLNNDALDSVYRKYTAELSTAKDEEAIDRIDRIFDKQDSTISRFLRAVKLTGKRLNQRDFARKVAKVREGSNISNRNVAVSILARTLHLRDMVAESQMVEVEVNGKKIRGTLMEEAKGVDLGKLVYTDKIQGRKLEYSENALKQITSLQVFDILCGQIDRKTDNYMTVVKREGTGRKSKDTILGIKAIDNDMSCGMIDYEEDVVKCFGIRKNQKLRGYRQELPAISDDNGLLNVEAVDKDLKDRIMKLSPSFIDFLLAGILSAQEREAMKRRLIALKVIFQRTQIHALRTGARSVFLSTDEDWKKFKRKIETRGPLANTYLIDTRGVGENTDHGSF